MSVQEAHGYEMCAEAPFPAPVIKDDGSIAVTGDPVKAASQNGQADAEASAFKIDGWAEEKGAEVAVDKRQLVLVVADQLLRSGVIPHQAQCVIGGDPAAACGGAPAEAVAPFLFGDLMLVVDKVIHNRIIPSGDCQISATHVVC